MRDSYRRSTKEKEGESGETMVIKSKIGERGLFKCCYHRKRSEKLALLMIFVIALLGVALLFVASWELPSRIQTTTIKQQQQQQGIPSMATNNDDDDNEDYSMAHEQSYGFFTDMRQKDWLRSQQIVHSMQPNTCGNNCPDGIEKAAVWYQNNYEPEFSCLHERRIGNTGDGGKWVCDPHRIGGKKDCLIYSIGSNNDFSFEQDIFQRIGNHCEIHTFDPGNFSSTALRIHHELSVNLHYHQWGIDGTTNGHDKRTRRLQYLTLNETVHRLGHVGRTVDIFKIDCEGCELTTFDTWVQPNIIQLQQILVEVHAGGDFIKQDIPAFFQGMHQHGYVIFHKEPNIMWWTGAVEYCFLRLAPQFFI